MLLVNEMKIRSVVITMDEKGVYVLDLFEGAVRNQERT